MRRLVMLGALLLGACDSPGLPAPGIDSVTPSEGSTVDTVGLTLKVTALLPVRMDYGAQTATLDTGMTVRLEKPEGAVSQEAAVAQVKPGEVQAVVSSGLPEGLYDVRLTLADGRTAVLERGFTVTPPPALGFSFDPIAEQIAGVPFTITVRATGLDAQQFSGTATLTSKDNTLVTPGTMGPFSAGVRTERVSVDQPGSNWLKATAGARVGTSAPFNVRPKTQLNP